MPFVWSIGTIIGPAIGGTFANPSVAFPSLFSPFGTFSTFPYLLPNLICAALLLISILAGYFMLEETHPDMQPWSTSEDLDNTTAETPLMLTAGANADAGVDLRADTYGTFNTVDIHEEQQWQVNADGSSRPPSISSETEAKVFTKRVVMLVVALGIFTYHSMTYDHLLPIFLQDNRFDGVLSWSTSAPHGPGGIGLTTQAVGVIMSVNGLIALAIQGVVFPLFAEWLGVWRVFAMVTFLHPVAYFIVPSIAYLPENLLYTGIYVCLAIRNLLSIMAYPVILILLKEASPAPSVMGKINGLAASAGAACRTIAPPMAGYLYSIGAQQGFTGLAWWGSGFVAMVGAIQLFWVEREKKKIATVKSLALCLAVPESKDRMNEVVHIVVTEADV